MGGKKGQGSQIHCYFATLDSLAFNCVGGGKKPRHSEQNVKSREIFRQQINCENDLNLLSEQSFVEKHKCRQFNIYPWHSMKKILGSEDHKFRSYMFKLLWALFHVIQ